MPYSCSSIAAIMSTGVVHRLKLCLVHVAWLHVDDTKDIQNPGWNSINVVEPRVTKVVIVAPSNDGMDAASIWHEMQHIVCRPSNNGVSPKDQMSHSSSKVASTTLSARFDPRNLLSHTSRLL
jgi:hypothetical protein